MGKIFLSYRRADAGGYAGRIFDRLRSEFGKKAVFRDVDAIASGTRFPEAIARELEDCRVFIPVIGPAWTRAADEAGARRLDNAEDWVRIEVAAALARKVCVIPVTVGGAPMPSDKDLPDDLQDLALLQRRDLRDGDTWEHDLDLLVQRIAQELGTTSSRRKRRAIAAVASVLAVALLGWAAARYWPARVVKPNLTADPVVIFETGNKQNVTQRAEGPPVPAAFTTTQPYFITHVYTYHWNNGQGSVAGRIKLRRADGQMHGPWEVSAHPGHANAPNVNWLAQPKIVLPAGQYVVLDSEPQTWSYNTESGGRGFTMVKAQTVE